jgi:serine beta-lactamase-like protein LACTB, mitochondrial
MKRAIRLCSTLLAGTLVAGAFAGEPNLPVAEAQRHEEATAAGQRQPARGFLFPRDPEVVVEEDDDPLAVGSRAVPQSPPAPSGPGQLAAGCLVANPIPMEDAARDGNVFVDPEFAKLNHQTGLGQTSPMTHAIDQRVREIMCDQKVIGLGLGVIWKGKVAYVKGYGWARGWETASPDDDVLVGGQRTRFRWASVSKAVTGVAAMIAVQEGLLHLDQAIASAYQGCSAGGCSFDLPATYWGPAQGLQNAFVDPAWPFVVTPIPAHPQYALTPRMLLANRSGVQHYDNGAPGTNAGMVPSEAQKEANQGFVWALGHWTHRPLLFLPGTAYSYSTFGFNLAGAVLENATGDEFFPFVESRIASHTVPSPMAFFHPDDIYSGAFQGAPYFTEAHRAFGYTLDEETGQVTKDGTFGDVSYKAPGGGFISTTADMALFCEGLANERFVTDPALVEEMWSDQGQFFGAPPKSKGYGLGFAVGSRKGRRLIAHDGEQQAASARLALYPDPDPVVGKLCIVVMSNSRHLSPGSITNAVEDLIRNPAAPGPPGSISF